MGRSVRLTSPLLCRSRKKPFCRVVIALHAKKPDIAIRTSSRRTANTWRLTVKLRGRTEEPAIGAEGAQFPSARGANQEAPHGPLQRLLGARILIQAIQLPLDVEFNAVCYRLPIPRRWFVAARTGLRELNRRFVKPWVSGRDYYNRFTD